MSGGQNVMFDGRNIEVVEEPMVSILKLKTPMERIAIANGLWCQARSLIYPTVKDLNPGWDENAVNKEVARRMSSTGEKIGD